MRPSFNESLVCELEPRINSTFETEVKGWKFKARELIPTTHGRMIEGTVGSEMMGLTIYSTNCPYLVRPGDRITVSGNRYTVDRVELHKDRISLLNSSKYKEDYLERIVPKTIHLV